MGLQFTVPALAQKKVWVELDFQIYFLAAFWRGHTPIGTFIKLWSQIGPKWSFQLGDEF